MPRETPKKRKMEEVMKDISDRTKAFFKKGSKQKYKSAADVKRKKDKD